MPRRAVLEWRLDPSSPWRLDPSLAVAAHHFHRGMLVVVLCPKGYSSSLVAATVQRLALRQATDVIGGFEAWRAAGLPVRRTLTPAIGYPAMRVAG